MSVPSFPDRSLLERIEAYLDAVPRSSATAEDAGKFTLFRSAAPWPYYARPRLGLADRITADDVARVRATQRALKLPETIEWVFETTPSLAEAALAAGMRVERSPLVVLERATFVAPIAADAVKVRFVEADDPDFLGVHAVATVGFGAPGTQVGREGAEQRDAVALATAAGTADFMRERARRELSRTAAAFDPDGPLAVGTHQPVNGVTEVVGIATLPAARRRGLGAVVTAALVEDAWTRGVRTVFLSAGSADVARVYARIGFRQIGSAGAAEPPRATAG